MVLELYFCLNPIKSNGILPLLKKLSGDPYLDFPQLFVADASIIFFPIKLVYPLLHDFLDTNV